MKLKIVVMNKGHCLYKQRKLKFSSNKYSLLNIIDKIIIFIKQSCNAVASIYFSLLLYHLTSTQK